MNFHHGLSSSEFILWLRESAIKGNMPPAFIAAIDNLQTVEDLEAEIETLGDQISELEKDRDNILEELGEFVRVVDENVDPEACPRLEKALKIAKRNRAAFGRLK